MNIFSSPINFWAFMAMHQERFNGIPFYATFFNDPFFNLLFITEEAQKNDISSALQSTNKYTNQQNLVGFTLWIKADLVDEHLRSLIKNYSLEHHTSPIMGLSLNVVSLPPVDILTKVEEVTQFEQFEDWFYPMREAFKTKNDDYLSLNKTKSFGGKSSLRHFIGYFEGIPVTAATLFIDHDIVMLQNMGTLPTEQHKGFGKNLLIYLLTISKNIGAKRVLLESSSEGYRLYQSVGFKELGHWEIWEFKH